MKKKHRLEKILQSVFGNHSDAENFDALPNMEEIDRSVEKILKILHKEEGGSVSSENSFDKSELASLIDGFHKRYQVVQCCYDHLIGKLKKEIRPKSNDNGSFSIDFTSSDSEDSDSGSEELSDKEKKLYTVQVASSKHVPLKDYQNLQGQLESMKIKNVELETMVIEVSAKLKEEQASADELTENAKLLRAEMDVLIKESQVSHRKEEDMNQKMKSLYEENDTLRAENAEAFSKIHEANISLKDFQTELNQIKDEMERVKLENSILMEELDRTSNEVYSFNQQLISANEEKEALRSGNFECLRRIEESEKALAALRDHADQKLKPVTEELTSENAHLISENENLKLRLEDAARQEEEVISLKSEIRKSSDMLEEAEKTIGSFKTELGLLRDRNSELMTMNLNQQLEDEIVEDEALTSKWTSERQEAVEVIHKAEDKASMHNSELLVDYEKMKQELEAANDKVSELKLSLQSIEDEKKTLVSENSALMNKIQQAEKAIDDLNVGIERIMTEHKDEIQQLSNDNNQLETNGTDPSLEMEAVNSQLIDLKKVTEAFEGEKTSLTSEIETLKCELVKLQEENAMLEHKQNEVQQQKNYLEGSYKEVVTKLELTKKEGADKDRENAKLYKRAENFEVQLRLSNQMIKITETECNEKIEEYKQAMEEMVEDCKEMEEHMLKICIKMNYLENELRHFKGFAEYGIPDLIRRYNELDSAFVHSSSHILKKISMFSEEMKVMKKWVIEMKNEKQELSVRVKYQEGIISIMKDEMESIVGKLVNKEKEVAILRVHIIESEERMKALEEMLRDVKKEILDKDEGKREAIRQLCLLIDYHRENNDHLCKYMSSVFKTKRG